MKLCKPISIWLVSKQPRSNDTGRQFVIRGLLESRWAILLAIATPLPSKKPVIAFANTINIAVIWTEDIFSLWTNLLFFSSPYCAAVGSPTLARLAANDSMLGLNQSPTKLCKLGLLFKRPLWTPHQMEINSGRMQEMIHLACQVVAGPSLKGRGAGRIYIVFEHEPLPEPGLSGAEETSGAWRSPALHHHTSQSRISRSL